MNKNELIEKITAKTGKSKKASSDAVNYLIEEVSSVLKKKEKVTLVGFGTFKTVARKARIGVNPKTGQKITIKAANVPKFYAGKALKEKVK